MLCRPVSPSGDILPVLSHMDLLSGPLAVAAALRDHLSLFTGEWWESPSIGNEVLDLLQDARGTEQEADTLVSSLTDYILTFPGAASVSDASAGFSGRSFTFSCTVHTEDGSSAEISFFTRF